MIRFSEKDPYAPICYTYEVSNILFRTKSDYQEILVFENPYFGKIMVLDGVVQITERDEFFYHEMLTHVVMHSHPDPRNIIVIGGGDGGTVREVVKHPSVEKVYFIEIDREVINTAKKYFPSVSCEIDNPKVEIHNMDGAEFVRSRQSDIDVVIVDSTDIVGFATSLFTEEFFSHILSCLGKDGMYVTLSESLHFHRNLIVDVQNKMKKVFPIVDLYSAPIATYGGNWWSFSVGSKIQSPRDVWKPTTVDTKYYCEDIHKTCFLPRNLYSKLMDGTLNW